MKAGRHSFETLNLLRGIAALAVLVWHFPLIDGPRYWSAYLSVDLFFILSGVVVAHAYDARLQAGWRFWRFALARVIRLWPLYILGSFVGAMATTAAISRYGLELWRFKPVLAGAGRAMLLMPQFAAANEVAFPFNPPAWSLFCELVVNLIYGWALVHLRSRWLLLSAAVGASLMIIGSLWFHEMDQGLNLGALTGHLWVGLARASFSFSVGVLIYRAWCSGRLPRITMSAPIIASLFLLLVVLVPGEGPWSTSAALAARLSDCPCSSPAPYR